jgi:tRNA dimethylallyltransferase
MRERTVTNITESSELIGLLKGHLEEARAAGLPPLVVVLGPTASGKTALGIALARFLGGEIVSADSRQVYRRLSIGTAKPTALENSLARHHLIDYVDPDEPYSLARFQHDALAVIAELLRRGKIPLLVGGTGLYISSIIQNYHLSDARPDRRLRLELEKLAQEKGNDALHAELSRIDPQAAARIHPHNLRYVIRALEIASQVQNRAPNGSAVEAWPVDTTASRPAPSGSFHSLLLTVDWPRQDLYARIDQRIDRQLEEGLLQEVQSLFSQYDRHLPSLTSLGYTDLAACLDGKITLEQGVDAFKRHTRNYAKRQLTWFRRFRQVYSIPGTLLAEIIAALPGKND